MREKYGQLSNVDINAEIEAKQLLIQPFEEKQLKAASFDITPSCIIMSVHTGRLVKIYSERVEATNTVTGRTPQCPLMKNKKCVQQSDTTEHQYIYIQPRDTVLVLSKEYLQLPDYICGNVFSRVSTVSSGLGHISTTIDPMWKGALLIAISNPSSEKKKFIIQNTKERDVQLATVTLQYLNQPAEAPQIKYSHLPARVDILEKYLFSIDDSKNRWAVIRKAITNFVHIKQYQLTVSVISELKEMQDVSAEEWQNALKELEEKVCKRKIAVKAWQKPFNYIWRHFKTVLRIAILCMLAFLLYSMLNSQGDSSNGFLASMILVVLEVILGHNTN